MLNINFEFDKENNKISLFYKDPINSPLKCWISVADVDSKQAIYAFNTALHNGGTTWTVPLPRHILDKCNYDKGFRGYTVQIFNEDKSEVLHEEIIMMFPEVEPKSRVILPYDPFNLTWINYQEMFVGDLYKAYNLDFKGLCIDVGANDGLFTNYILSQGANKVYSFECDPRALKNLTKSFYNNSSVIIVDKALWKESQLNMPLSINDDASTVSTMVPDQLERNQRLIYIDTLDWNTFIKRYDVDSIKLLKLDIEGAEYEVLKSLSDEQILKVEQFLIEVHWNTNGEIYQLTDRLKSLGYSIEVRRHTEDNALLTDESEYANYKMCTFAAKKTASTSKKKTLKQIKVNHLLTVPTDEREVRSIESLTQLQQFKNVEYIQRVNSPYKDLPPSETCARPHDVQMEPGYYKLSPGHYGCWLAHSEAILACDPDPNNIYLFFECDALLQVDPQIFYDKVLEASKLSDRYGYVFFSFAHNYETFNTYTTHLDAGMFTEAHAYLINGNKIKQLQDYIKQSKWDVFDLWVTNNFRKQPKGFYKEPLVLQGKGYSLLDKQISETNIKGDQKI